MQKGLDKKISSGNIPLHDLLAIADDSDLSFYNLETGEVL